MSQPTLTDLAEAVADLQARYAFQEDHVQALNQVVADQQRSIDTLTKALRAQASLLEQIQGQQGGEGVSDLLSERPPHY